MIVGLDPGKTGGIAMLSDRGEFVAGMRMPLLQHGKRDLVDPTKLDAFIGEYRGGGMDGVFQTVTIELVNSMPKQGVASTFAFGRHTGALECWALSTGRPVRWVTPAKWKKHFGLSSDKRASLDRARLEFGQDPLWDVKANDGIAEAALIALWSLRDG